MSDHSILNSITTLLADHLTDLGITNVKWPNVDLDTQNLSEYVQISITPYMSKRLTYGGTRHHFGVVTISVFVDRNQGQGHATSLATNIAECISNRIIDKIVFEGTDLKILGVALSQTQTTTAISKFQVNANVEYSRVD